MASIGLDVGCSGEVHGDERTGENENVVHIPREKHQMWQEDARGDDCSRQPHTQEPAQCDDHRLCQHHRREVANHAGPPIRKVPMQIGPQPSAYQWR